MYSETALITKNRNFRNVQVFYRKKTELKNKQQT